MILVGDYRTLVVRCTVIGMYGAHFRYTGLADSLIDWLTGKNTEKDTFQHLQIIFLISLGLLEVVFLHFILLV